MDYIVVQETEGKVKLKRTKQPDYMLSIYICQNLTEELSFVLPDRHLCK
jgi:hypothetical protein